MDVRFPPDGLEQRLDQRPKRPGVARADIEDAVCGSVVEKPEGRRDGVVDVNEVPQLLAVGVALAMALEQIDRFAAAARA